MKNLEHFAEAPQQSPGRITNNTVVSPEVITYLEDESDFRQYFVVKPTNGVFSQTYKIEREDGMAVQVAGNSEVPRAEPVNKYFTVFLKRIATGYAIDDDDRRINANDPSFETRKMQYALKRMVRKQNYDMANVLISGAGSTTAGNTGKLTVALIKQAILSMISAVKTARDENEYAEPDTIFMSYAKFIELQADEDFKLVPEIYREILLSNGITGSTSNLSGPTGQSVAGLNIVIMNELINDVIIIDSKREALWLVEDTAPTITKYRDEEHISDIVDIRHDLQPVCVFPEFIHKITFTEGTGGVDEGDGEEEEGP